ncbi:hypothetical protein M378DRAFT_14550 [Amanita muscaria Koide BX008]|uniref:Uncharacterized protein n=1 Tax=Amanita muscaria (strain Koide BX008) TaxID=946122 RepID=A0A0C2WTX4_AMAMK|nr:hypothetical protein M378DRAFT_14550 [Amanita muscaria Koide BX008]
MIDVGGGSGGGANTSGLKSDEDEEKLTMIIDPLNNLDKLPGSMADLLDSSSVTCTVNNLHGMRVDTKPDVCVMNEDVSIKTMYLRDTSSSSVLTQITTNPNDSFPIAACLPKIQVIAEAKSVSP